MAKLLATVRLLSVDEAGGHGDKWDVFAEDVDRFIAYALTMAVKEGDVVIDEMKDSSTIPTNEEPVSILQSFGSQKVQSDSISAIVTVLGSAEDENHGRINTLISFFPMFSTDISYRANISGIDLFPNRLEARLWLEINNLPFNLCIFDTMFGVNRGKYERETSYAVVFSGLAYYMRSTEGDEFKIEDEEGIRKHRATNAWVEKHDFFSRETDLEAALSSWEPSSPKDLEPVVFDLSRRRTYMPHDSFADDAQFAGEVVRVIPDDIILCDVSFWRVDVNVGIFEDEDETGFIIPFYITEKQFEEKWRPEVGEWVSGNSWINGYINIKNVSK